MIDLEKMANYIVDKMSPINVKSQQCAKIRSPLSKCSQCQSICPQQRIKFSATKVILADNCLECGLCASVCPTEALSLQEPDIIMILNKIEQAHSNDGIVNITCRRNSATDEKCIKVPCLGALRVEMLLVMRLFDFPVHVVFEEERCDSCAVKGGLDLFKTRIAEAEELLKSFSLTAQELVQVTKPVILKTKETKEIPKKHQDVDMGKRALFGSLFSGFRKVPGVVIQSYLGTNDNGEKQTEIAPRSRAADSVYIKRFEILKRYVYGKVQNINQELPVVKQPVLTDTCYFCKVCTTLCPTGALAYSEDSQEILLNSSRCSGCNLCAEVCFHKSLTIIPVSLERVLTSNPKNFVKGYANTCESCGKPFMASEATVKCAKCRAREKNNS